MKKSFSTRLKKKDDQLKHVLGSHLQQYLDFVKSVPDGSIVEMYMNVVSEDGSLAQLAKLHVMIKDLASFTGNSPMAMKLVIKSKAGLCFGEGDNFECKSFGDCSSEELSLAIQTAILFGESVGFPIS